MVILGLVDLTKKSNVYLHDKDFLSLYYMKQNPDSDGRCMFVPRKKHAIAIKEVKLVDRQWNSRYAMVRGVVDEVGSPWIAPTVWGRPERARNKLPAITNEFVEKFVKMKNAQKTPPELPIGIDRPLLLPWLRLMSSRSTKRYC
ncbi:hypothetical protein L484_002937 [Morus notabilis]|uniref:Uncharacterized protein n=1 Tax=Morus notabilis TaxID=981085 RepID=W9SK43_9ROSA|nr:hypothetical protein L484_002937 [Morus notabilis]